MKLRSTSGHGGIFSFAEAVERGIAEDGGLFMPVSITRFGDDFFVSIGSLSFVEIAFRVAGLLLEGEIPDPDLRTIVEESMTFPAPLHELDNQTSLLELFHGPTLAFKDFGARFMAKTMEYLHRNDSREATVLVATSGDTGSAVAHGFHNVKGIRVCLLYPSGRVSTTQEQQLTTVGGNTTALEVDGSFDDCQRLVKQAFADKDLAGRLNLTSANSINIARLLPQTFYYFHAFACRQNSALPVVFSVPSGNLGNLTAGLVAWKMGLPAERFVAATNANDVFTRFLGTGEFKPGRSVATLSNAMDVGNPSNFVRISHLFDGKLDSMRRILSSATFTDSQTKNCITDVYDQYGYILDPHGAVGVLAMDAFRIREKRTVQGIVLETAHPAKFLEVYDERIRQVISVPERLRAALEKKKISVSISSR
ncbi:MAG TPA: threonine synthase, partial [Bacteroidota bacterium]|nr:threonine synthase [Bacteroidota bacterium]